MGTQKHRMNIREYFLLVVLPLILSHCSVSGSKFNSLPSSDVTGGELTPVPSDTANTTSAISPSEPVQASALPVAPPLEVPVLEAKDLATLYQFSLYDGGPVTNYRGANEKYFVGRKLNDDNDGWYFILPDGSVYAWSFSGLIAGSKLLGKVAKEYYLDPTTLIESNLPNHLPSDPATLRSLYGIDLSQPRGRLNYRGWNEKYLHGKDDGYNLGLYFILPTGTVYKWGGSLQASVAIARLNPSFYLSIVTP